jgi:branched-chain amino acid transport system substrate-binding protein
MGAKRAGLALLGIMALSTVAAQTAWAQISGNVVRIGILNDQSGVFSDSSGQGSFKAAEMAVQDYGGKVAGVPVEVIFADHQNKPDVGALIARRWMDEQGVDAIVDLGNSAVAFAVLELAKQRNKAILLSAGASTDFTGKACAPVTVQWTFDSYSASNAVVKGIMARGGDSWFYLTADYTYGKNLEEGTRQLVEAAGGKNVGTSRFPLQNNDFSSNLLSAQGSGAKVVAIAAGGNDTGNALKQANEFGVTKKQTVTALNGLAQDFYSIGIPTAQGALASEPFYWDLNDGTRAFSERYGKIMGGKMPSMIQAGVYAVVTHYLKAVDKVKNDGGKEAVDAMKALPTDDPLFGKGTIRADGRKLHPFYLFQVKTPAESKGPWDLYKVIGTVPADQAFKPMKGGGCPMVE